MLRTALRRAHPLADDGPAAAMTQWSATIVAQCAT